MYLLYFDVSTDNGRNVPTRLDVSTDNDLYDGIYLLYLDVSRDNGRNILTLPNSFLQIMICMMDYTYST